MSDIHELISQYETSNGTTVQTLVTPFPLLPRTGREASWTTEPGGVAIPPSVGDWPVSSDPPKHVRHPFRDVLVTALVALVLAAIASAYVLNVFNGNSTNKVPSSSNDPFATSNFGGR